MNDIPIIYKVQFNVGEFKDKILDVHVYLSELEVNSLAEILIEKGYIKIWCNKNEFIVLDRHLIIKF